MAHIKKTWKYLKSCQTEWHDLVKSKNAKIKIIFITQKNHYNKNFFDVDYIGFALESSLGLMRKYKGVGISDKLSIKSD